VNLEDAPDDHAVGKHTKSAAFHSPDDRLADARLRIRVTAASLRGQRPII
jgi:hypothetical protein